MAVGTRPGGEEAVPFFFTSKGEGVYVNLEDATVDVQRLGVAYEPGFTPTTTFDLPTLLNSDVFQNFEAIKGQTYFMNVKVENFAHLSTHRSGNITP